MFVKHVKDKHAGMSFADLIILPEPEDVDMLPEDAVMLDSSFQTAYNPASSHAPDISNSQEPLATNPLLSSPSSSSSLPQAMATIRIPQVGPWMARTSNPAIVSDSLHNVHVSLLFRSLTLSRLKSPPSSSYAAWSHHTTTTGPIPVVPPRPMLGLDIPLLPVQFSPQVESLPSPFATNTADTTSHVGHFFQPSQEDDDQNTPFVDSTNYPEEVLHEMMQMAHQHACTQTFGTNIPISVSLRLPATPPQLAQNHNAPPTDPSMFDPFEFEQAPVSYYDSVHR